MIDLDRAKEHLRVDFGTEDELIGAYLAAAIDVVEKRTGRLLAERALVQRLDAFPGAVGAPWPRHGARHAIALHHDPVISVEGIDYVGADGTTVTLTSGAGQFRTVEGEPYLLLPGAGLVWPATLAGGGAVSIRYTAGYGSDAVPGALDAAVLLIVGHLYANREAVTVGVLAGELPMGVQMLCAPFCRIGLS